MQIIEINDFDAPELDVYARLTENQLLNRENPEEGIFIAESPKVVERALDAGCDPLSVLVERKHIAGEAKNVLARLGDVPVYTSDFEVLTRLTGYRLTRGMLCAMRRPPAKSVEEICRGAHRIVVLEEVMNPTNVGAIFRSAAAMGMDGILLTKGCSNPLYRRAIRVSMGTVFQIPWTFPEGEFEGSQAVETLRGLGFTTAAMALRKDSVPIDDPRLCNEDKLAVILGTEGDGLADATITGCDYTVMIPMAPGIDSLNVAAAGAVAFWQLGDPKNRSRDR